MDRNNTDAISKMAVKLNEQAKLNVNVYLSLSKTLIIYEKDAYLI